MFQLARLLFWNRHSMKNRVDLDVNEEDDKTTVEGRDNEAYAEIGFGAVVEPTSAEGNHFK